MLGDETGAGSDGVLDVMPDRWIWVWELLLGKKLIDRYTTRI
jgi:hypothetical protein